MPKDRDQLTPADPEDAEHLATHRGQGTAATGRDLLSEPAGSGGTTQPAGSGGTAEPAGSGGTAQEAEESDAAEGAEAEPVE